MRDLFFEIAVFMKKNIKKTWSFIHISRLISQNLDYVCNVIFQEKYSVLCLYSIEIRVVLHKR